MNAFGAVAYVGLGTATGDQPPCVAERSFGITVMPAVSGLSASGIQCSGDDSGISWPSEIRTVGSRLISVVVIV